MMQIEDPQDQRDFKDLLGDSYEYIRLLGEGAFGKVELYRRVQTKPSTFILDRLKSRPKKSQSTAQYFALKKFNFNNPQQNHSTLRQLKYLISLDHPNIIKGRGAILSRNNRKQTKPGVYLILDYMLQLHETLESVPNLWSNQLNLKVIAYHILVGLNFLHKNMILHRDLKPENIFVSKDGMVKIADFGFAREFGTPNKKLSTNICTIEYRSPEIFFGSQYYTQKADIWSFGCIVAYLYTKRMLFPSESGNEIETLKKIFFLCGTPNEENWPGFSEFPVFMKFEPLIKPKKIASQYANIPVQAAVIIQQCLQLNPWKRPSCRQLLASPFFSGLESLTLNVQQYYTNKLNHLATGHT